MFPRIFLAALGLTLASQAMAQAPQFPGSFTTYGPYGQAFVQPMSQVPQFQQPQMPQSWTGNQIGGFTHWNGSNGGQVTCNRIGQFTFCN